MKTTKRMRILTWNIHKGIGGLDRRYELDRVIDLLSGFDADLLLLQEVDSGARRSRFHDQAEMIAERLHLPHFAASINHHLRRGGGYGNVTLSRHPISHTENVDLTVPLKKGRGALFTRVETPVGSLSVFNAHLGLLHAERLRQARHILGSPHLGTEGCGAIIAGDTNDWRGRLCKRVMEPHGFRDAGHAINGKRRRTFPAVAPLLSLDRMYIRGLTPTALVPGCPRLSRRASDHRPLVADFAPIGQSEARAG